MAAPCTAKEIHPGLETVTTQLITSCRLHTDAASARALWAGCVEPATVTTTVGGAWLQVSGDTSVWRHETA